MVVTAKQLRLQTSKILKAVQRTGSVTVTLRGKPVAKISALTGQEPKDMLEYRAIGMWADREDMKDPSAWVRRIRKPRYSPH
jgi:antitoxin (DNA-binding transcriptional repressor) of toxin-antitoxin stability system